MDHLPQGCGKSHGYAGLLAQLFQGVVPQRVHDGVGHLVEQRTALPEFLQADLILRGGHRFRFGYQYHLNDKQISGGYSAFAACKSA